jgi:hypothetical protein
MFVLSADFTYTKHVADMLPGTGRGRWSTNQRVGQWRILAEGPSPALRFSVLHPGPAQPRPRSIFSFFEFYPSVPKIYSQLWHDWELVICMERQLVGRIFLKICSANLATTLWLGMVRLYRVYYILHILLVTSWTIVHNTCICSAVVSLGSSERRDGWWQSITASVSM